jgi:serine/threonine-protein kinase
MNDSIGPALLQAVVEALALTSAAPLKEGGQKSVYSGDIEGHPVVVKIISLSGEHVKEARERAYREVELLASIDSDYVVRVVSDLVEVGGEPGVIAWAEELLDGCDLTALLDHAWGPGELLGLLNDVARGLASCHAVDVVHRDLSPNNIRRCSNGRYVIMDPGYARHLTKEALTGKWQPGTPGFMTPEHIPGGSPVPASDIYGLGIITYLAATRTLPIPIGTSMEDYFGRLRDSQSASVVQSRPDLPEVLVRVIDRCLLRQSARRYIDADELLVDLDSMVGG